MSRSSTDLAASLPRREPRAEVEALIERNGLRFLIAHAIRLASEYLPLVSEPTYEKGEDPDSGAEWIELTARVRGNRSDVREAHRRFTHAWLSVTPPERTLDVRLAISFA